MKRIEYPAKGSTEWKALIADYKALFAVELAVMEQKWSAWKTAQGVTTIPETVEELLTADAGTLADVYGRFIAKKIKLTDGHKHRNPILKELDDIFDYNKLYGERIAQFFVERADELHISSCFYCETAYINVYQDKQRQFDVDHFLPKSKCPIVGLSLFNFVPSCQVCNSRIKRAKTIGKNKAEWEKFNPASDKYEFEQNVTIRLRMHRGPDTTFKKKGEYYIFFHCKNGYNRFAKFFHLEERYEFHKQEAMRMKRLKAKYPQSARKKIAQIIKKTEAEVEEDLFHRKYLKDNYRCFAKLAQDMLK